LSGPGQEAIGSPVILDVKVGDGESERKVREVLVKVYEPGRLQMAWQQVRKNAGATGIDQMTVAEFAQWEDELLARIHDKLASGSYRFQPARRVEIPKPGASKTRKLGIPVVMDRIVGTSMHSVLLTFSGCRPISSDLARPGPVFMRVSGGFSLSEADFL
jgi:hypothetical protein